MRNGMYIAAPLTPDLPGVFMATLQNLPAELVTIIFDLLGDIAALRSLCLVSKYLCGIAQHLLYRNIFHEFSNTSNCFLRWLFLLTNTIVTCPQLASQVRRITLDVTEDSEPCGGEGESYGCYHEAGFPGAIHDGNGPRGMPHGYSLKLLLLTDSGDRYSNMTALTSLLLSHALHIEDLTAAIDCRGLRHLTQMPTENYPGPLLSGLKVLNLTSSGSGQMKPAEIRLADIVPLLSLPRLVKMKVDHCRGYNPAGTSYLTPTCAPLRSLVFSEISFRYSCVDAYSIQTLIAACKTLKVFRYRYCASPVNQFNPSELKSALDTHKDSLERLEVSYYDNMEDRDYARIWIGATYGSFDMYKSLCSLDLDQAFLDPFPIFPPSLKRFALRNCYDSVFHTMSHIAREVKQGAIPLLGEVYMSTDVLAPGGMLDLPLRGATDVLFEASCEKVKSLFIGTGVCVGFEDALLSKVADDYSFAFECDRSGLFWPLIYLK